MPSRRTFGVEIEFLAPTIPSRVDFLPFGGIKTDGSVADPARRLVGREFYSHVLEGQAGELAVRGVCRHLASIGATVNATCGLHVHYGAQGLNRPQLGQIAQWWRLYGRVFYACVDPSRRRNRYCRPWGERTLRSNGLEWPSDRYHGLNMYAIESHRTIEIRLHHGTLDANEILSFARMGMRFIEFAAATPCRAGLAEFTNAQLVKHFAHKLAMPRAERDWLMARIHTFNRRATLARETLQVLKREWRRAG